MVLTAAQESLEVHLIPKSDRTIEGRAHNHLRRWTKDMDIKPLRLRTDDTPLCLHCCGVRLIESGHVNFPSTMR